MKLEFVFNKRDKVAAVIVDGKKFFPLPETKKRKSSQVAIKEIKAEWDYNFFNKKEVDEFCERQKAFDKNQPSPKTQRNGGKIDKKHRL